MWRPAGIDDAAVETGESNEMSIQLLMRFGLALGVGLAASVAQAQPRPPDAEMKRAAEEMARAVKGWPGGIVFTCVVAPAALETATIKDLCNRSTADASALAAQVKIKFTRATDTQNFLLQIARERALGLTVVISPSDFNAPVAALVIRIKASRQYADVVSAAARSAPNPAQNPLAVPRGGEVVFWEELVVGSGPPSQLAAAMVPQIETKLKQFFAELR
jgi:hypothetical protein